MDIGQNKSLNPPLQVLVAQFAEKILPEAVRQEIYWLRQANYVALINKVGPPREVEIDPKAEFLMTPLGALAALEYRIFKPAIIHSLVVSNDPHIVLGAAYAMIYNGDKLDMYGSRVLNGLVSRYSLAKKGMAQIAHLEELRGETATILLNSSEFRDRNLQLKEMAQRFGHASSFQKAVSTIQLYRSS